MTLCFSLLCEDRATLPLGRGVEYWLICDLLKGHIKSDGIVIRVVGWVGGIVGRNGTIWSSFDL